MAAVLSQVSCMSGMASDSVVNPNGNLCVGAISSDVSILRQSDNHTNGRAVHASADHTELKVDIVNVLCNFKTHCHLDLRTIAMTGTNVEFRRDPSSVMMKLRSPAITATIWSSGKIICMGARSEADALLGARRVARKLQNCGFKLRFVDFQVKNVLGIVCLPFGVRIDRLKDAYSKEVSYEPELHPAASWRLPEVGGQLQVFQTGNLSVTAPNVEAAQKTFQIIYPKLYEFRKAKEQVDVSSVRAKKEALEKSKRQKTMKPITPSLDQKSLKAFVLPPEFQDFMDLDDAAEAPDTS